MSVEQTILPSLEQGDPPSENSRLYYPIKAVSEMLDLSARRIRSYETAAGIEIARQLRGNLSYRRYTIEDVFSLAAYKRTLPDFEALPRSVTAAVYLPKGGVGKSSVTTEMAVHWSLMGYRVLLIDCDPQGSSTVIFGYEPEAEPDTAEAYGVRPEDLINYTFANLLPFPDIQNHAQTCAFSDVLKMPYGANGPHLIPADVTLAAVFYDLGQTANRDNKIASWLNVGRTKPTAKLDLSGYDIILFDNAPATSILSRASLVASDFCIAPVRLDALSAKSLSFVSSEFESLLSAELPAPELISVPTFHAPQTARSKQILTGLWQRYPDSMIDGRIRASEIFPRSLLKARARERMPVSLQHPTHPVVREDLATVARDIVGRFREVV